MPKPLRLLARLMVVASLVSWLAYHYQRAIMEPLLPLVRATVQAVDRTFTVLAVDIDTQGPSETIRLRADLALPIVIGGRTFYPFREGGNQRGWYEVTLTVGGTMEYSLLTLIVVLAWPANRWQELFRRVLVSLPLMLTLLLVNVATTFPAELWNRIHAAWVPDMTWPLLVWSRILMGGGGLLLGLLSGAVAILDGHYNVMKPA